MSAKLHDLKDYGYGCEIIFSCGKTAWLQGDEANDLVKEIDACETHEQIHNILSEYEVLIQD